MKAELQIFQQSRIISLTDKLSPVSPGLIDRAAAVHFVSLNMSLPASTNRRNVLVCSERPIFKHPPQMELSSDSSETECDCALLTLPCAPLSDPPLALAEDDG